MDDLAAMITASPLVARATGVSTVNRCGRKRQNWVPDVVDLDLSCFKQRLNLEYLLRWWESSQLMGGHSEIGAQRLVHLLIVHHEELLLEITSERW